VLRKPRWSYLLEEDSDFRRWHENLARGSTVTANERARVLYRFLTSQGMNPKELVERAKRNRREVEDLLSDFIGEQLKDGKSPGYLENYLKSVRSWLNYNEVRLVRRIKVGNRNLTPTIEDERVPIKKELRQILNYADERGKCSIALIAFSGLRPQVLGNADGKGLEIRDFPELKIGDHEATFAVVPSRINVRSELSKTKCKYFTFLPNEGCEYLKAYLEKRISNGETLEPNSAVIAVKTGYEDTGLGENRTTQHVSTKTITKEIRDAMRPRFKWRPYVLRAYFDTQLLVAENHGKISHAYRQFFMGHKGDIEARYTTNKGRLPPAVIEDMRQSSLKCEEYLSTRPVSREEDPELTTIRTMVESGVLDLSKMNVRTYLLKKLGIKDMDVRIAKMKNRGIKEDEAYVRTISSELGIKPMQINVSKEKDNDDPKKIVNEEDVERYLEDGWDVQTVLPSGRILIKK
jgi:hypothetical protein